MDNNKALQKIVQGDKALDILREESSLLNRGLLDLDLFPKEETWRSLVWKDKNLNIREDVAEKATKSASSVKEEGYDVIICSDMKRSIQMAEVISKFSGVPIGEISPCLRPWNLGDLRESLGLFFPRGTENLDPIIKDYVEKTPNISPPNGESFNQFRDRFLNGMKKIAEHYPEQKIHLTIHFSGVRMYRAWIAMIEKNRGLDLGSLSVDDLHEIIKKTQDFFVDTSVFLEGEIENDY